MTHDVQADLTSVLHGVCFAVPGDRAFLRITGSDATRWLNGMVTNSVQALSPGEGNYNFLLNAQGRIQGDCRIYRSPSSSDAPEFLLLTDAAQLEAISAHLDRFIIMDDVELTPASEDETSLVLLGPEAPKQLESLGLPVLAPLRMVHAESPHGPVLLITPASLNVLRFELRASAAVISALRRQLEIARIATASPDLLEQLRMLEGAPRYGVDIHDRDLPQEANQPHALHFTKGCYLGQEIVERVRSRGQVHRLLTPLLLQGSIPELPARLEAEGKAAGEITSAIEIAFPADSAILALGYVRREALDTGKTLTYSSGVAHPRAPGAAR